MTVNQQPAVFVDRDDTLIADPGYLRDPNQIRILPGVPDALKRLREGGFAVVIVTNQSGVARGFLTEEELQTVHEHLQEQLAEKGAAVDAIYYCPFLDGREAVVEKYRQDSELRKPKPGMLLKAAADLRLDLSRSWMIGDSVRDVQAGRAAGCRTILLGGGATDPVGKPDHTMSNFPAAADFVLRESRRAAESQNSPLAAKRDRPVVAANRAQVADRGDPYPSVAGKTATVVRDERPMRVSPAGKTESEQVTATPASVKSPLPGRDSKESKRTTDATVAPSNQMQSAEKKPTADKSSPPERTDASLDPKRSQDDAGNIDKKRAEHDMPSTVEVAEESKRVQEAAPEPTVRHRDANDPVVLLDEILEEIRAIRRQRQFADFSFMQLAGAIAQAFAVCAVIFGLYSIANGQSDRADLALLAGIAFQLMALTGFVASRRR